MVLVLQTALHRYAVLHDQGYELRLFGDQVAQSHVDSANRPLLSAPLAPLLDPADSDLTSRRRALIVPLRRRSVALLFERVLALHPVGAEAVLPLPPLLASRLDHSWITGVYMLEAEPILMLDLRLIAQYVLRQTSATQQGAPV